jgi:hypothetical protein
MGTSSSGGGPKGRTPLLPNWATGGSGSPPAKEDDLPSQENSESTGDDSGGVDSDDRDRVEDSSKDSSTSSDYSGNWTSGRSSFRRFINSNGSSKSLRKAAQSYVKSMGGHSKATKAASKGISVGGNYIEFLGGVRKNGLEQTLQDYGLSDCIGKSPEEALAKIAGKIAPIGTTNDEIIARSAVMTAVDALYVKLTENGVGIEAISSISEEALKDSVIEYVSAYIFKKWIYELGLALEQNDLSEREAIVLENQVKSLVRDEVKASLKQKDVLKLNFQEGEGKRIIENIFALAYSTLGK